MKTVYKKISPILFATCLAFSGSLAHAESFKTKDLAFSFPLFNFFDSTPAKENENETENLNATETENKSEGSEGTMLAKGGAAQKDACDYFDSTTDKVLNLETASANAKQRIENVEETLDEETSLRDSILNSTKGLLGLQKKDKVIFREMKKEISDAKNYYADLDGKIETTHTYLSENACEDEEVEQAEKIDTETEDLVQDEATYRKQFAGSLKEKMKILQNSVKDAKK